jgi:hypothetical protein
MKPLILLLAWALALPAWGAWPEMPRPAHARVESLGDQIRMNGVPMRMYRVTVPQGAEGLVGFYRDWLGPKRAETELLGDTVLSQGRGTHFITVRVHALARDRAVALVSISDASAGRQGTAGSGIRLPAGTALLSDMESVDGGRSARHLVGQNQMDLRTNLNALEKELTRRGYRPEEQEYQGAEASLVRLYRGDRREARLVLTRRDATTFIELTTLNEL